MNFTGGFSSPPVVILTPEAGINDDNLLTLRNVTASSFKVFAKNTLGSHANEYEDTIFHFVAYGPRS